MTPDQQPSIEMNETDERQILLHKQSRDLVKGLNMNSKPNQTSIGEKLEGDFYLENILDIKEGEYLIIEGISNGEKTKIIQRYMGNNRYSNPSRKNGDRGDYLYANRIKGSMKNHVSQFNINHPDLFQEIIIVKGEQSIAPLKIYVKMIGKDKNDNLEHKYKGSYHIRNPKITVIPTESITEYDDQFDYEYLTQTEQFDYEEELIKKNNIARGLFNAQLKEFGDNLQSQKEGKFIQLPTIQDNNGALEIGRRECYKVISINYDIFTIHQCLPQGKNESMIGGLLQGKAYSVSFGEDGKVNLEDISEQENNKALREKLAQ